MIQTENAEISTVRTRGARHLGMASAIMHAMSDSSSGDEPLPVPPNDEHHAILKQDRVWDD
jgi:hypothetical protein